MVISDYEYFSLLKFLNMNFSHPDIKVLSAAPSKKPEARLSCAANLHVAMPRIFLVPGPHS